MAIRAEINKTAVNPLTDAYIGGKNDKGSTFAIDYSYRVTHVDDGTHAISARITL